MSAIRSEPLNCNDGAVHFFGTIDLEIRCSGKNSTAKELAMNWNQVEGNWEQFKGKVQKQWGKITNDDLDVINGSRKELVGRLQKHYGKAQEDIEREIDAWSTRL